MTLLSAESASQTQRPRRIIILFLLVAVAVVVLVNYYFIREWDKASQQKLEQEAALTVMRIEQIFAESFSVLDGLHALFHLHPQISYQEFSRFSEGLVEKQRALLAVQFADETTRVCYVYPQKNNEITLEEPITLLEDPLRREATLSAIEGRKRTLQEPFLLRQGGLGIVAREPVFLEETFLGLIIGVYSIDALMTTIMPQGYGELWNISVLDGKGEAIFTSSGEDSGITRWGISANPVEKAVKAGNLHWTLKMDFSSRAGSEMADLNYFFIFASSMLLFLITALAYRLYQYTHGLESLVHQRTRKLVNVNQSLEREKEETHKTMRQLQESRERYRTMVESISDGVISLSSDQIIRHCNFAAASLFKTRREMLVGTSILELIPEALRLEEKDYWSAFFQGKGEKQVRKIVALTAEEEQIPLEITFRGKGEKRVEEAIILLRKSNDLNAIYSRRKKHHQLRRTIGNSSSILEIIRQVEMVAPTDMNVLVQGESGTGKEIISRLIHDTSRRSSGPFIAIDCGAISSTLFESEIFGHEKGAFTGADERRKGKLELSRGGTLFLDEIGNLSFDNQAKILRLLQEKQYYRVGGSSPISADSRIITATNKNLKEYVQEGKFREDLFHRLNEFMIELPPLRKRKEDILHLAGYFMEEASSEFGVDLRGIDETAIQLLQSYRWPGNVRELRNVIRKASLQATGAQIQGEDLQLPKDPISSTTPVNDSAETVEALAWEIHRGEKNLTDALSSVTAALEKGIITSVLARTGGNRSEAASLMGINRKTLYKKMKEYSLE